MQDSTPHHTQPGHTQTERGPWTKGEPYVIHDPNPVFVLPIRAADGKLICEIRYPGQPENQDNADLICATPGLLAALVRIQEMAAEDIRQGRTFVCHSYMHQIEADARAALKAIEAQQWAAAQDEAADQRGGEPF